MLLYGIMELFSETDMYTDRLDTAYILVHRSLNLNNGPPNSDFSASETLSPCSLICFHTSIAHITNSMDQDLIAHLYSKSVLE